MLSHGNASRNCWAALYVARIESRQSRALRSTEILLSICLRENRCGAPSDVDTCRHGNGTFQPSDVNLAFDAATCEPPKHRSRADECGRAEAARRVVWVVRAYAAARQE